MWTQVLKPFGLRLAQKEDGYLGILTSPSASASSPLTLIEVVEGTAAEKMGLKKGDIITHINGTKVDTGNFRSLLQAMKPGAELKAEVKRKAETLTLVGNIGSRTGEITLDRIPKEELTGKEEALLKVLLASPAFYKKD